jgi:hypothetical protein
MPQTNLFTLDVHDVTDILRSMLNPPTSIPPTPPVCLVALDCNWGPPVSGRFDTDFLQVWAAADTRLKPKRVCLVGARDNSGWNIKLDLAPVSTIRVNTPVGEKEMELYFAALHSQHDFPNQFVIHMEDEGGSIYYDNNGGYGVNYRLVAYQGRMTSAVIGDPAKAGPGAPNGAIWLLPKFTSYVLAARSGSD